MMERYAIGIDIGGTKIAAGLISESAKVLFPKHVPTEAHLGGEAVLAKVDGLIQELLQKAQGIQIEGIGLGIAELVDNRGKISSSHTIKWQWLDVRSRLSRDFPMVIEADVRAAALAEARFGAGKNFKNFLFITVGTGISHSLVIAGTPYAGSHGNALLFASSPITIYDKNEAKTYPALEDFSSGPAIVKRYNQATGKTFLKGQEVVAASEQGDREAQFVLESAGTALGAGVGWLVNTLDPEIIVLGGGLGVSEGHYWQAFESSIRQHIWAEVSQKISLHKAAFGIEAAMLGAALKVFEGENIF